MAEYLHGARGSLSAFIIEVLDYSYFAVGSADNCHIKLIELQVRSVASAARICPGQILPPLDHRHRIVGLRVCCTRTISTRCIVRMLYFSWPLAAYH